MDATCARCHTCARALQHAPPLFTLPPLANTLDSSPANLAAAAAAAAPKKAGAKGGGKGGKGGKKKAVKFEDDGDKQSSGSPGAGAASRHTTSGGGGSTVQATSGGSMQAPGPAATQGITEAAAGGLGRLAAERWKQRSLLLPALAVLGVGAAPGQEHPCYAMLPSAAYLLADVHRWGLLRSRQAGTAWGLVVQGQAGSA